MKVTWEPTDIIVGRRVAKSKAVEQWIICYDPSVESDAKYAIVLASRTV